MTVMNMIHNNIRPLFDLLLAASSPTSPSGLYSKFNDTTRTFHLLMRRRAFPHDVAHSEERNTFLKYFMKTSMEPSSNTPISSSSSSCSQWYMIVSVALVIFLLLAITIVAVKGVYYVLRKHTADFAGKRLSRSHGKCHSTYKLEPPSIRNWNTFQKQLGKVEQMRRMSTSSRSSPLTRNVAYVYYDSNQCNEPSSSPSSSNAKNTSTDTATTTSSTTSGGNEKGMAKEHKMDHVYLNFFQLLWAFTFVGPLSYLLWKKATMMLKLRVFLVEEKGWLLKTKPTSLEEVVGKLVLEQSQVIHYVGQRRITRGDGKEDGRIASFLFPNFPIVNIEGKFQVANYLAVEIDLDTKRLVSCNLDDENLNASQALILLWYNTISAQHVKVHAYGNWGVNPGAEMKEVNPFYERSSIVSVVYNYFGFTSFPTFMEAWKKEGLLSKDWDPTALTDTFSHGVRENICEHSKITELLPYSDMVKFITKTRWIFHNEFRKHSDSFPGINAEGLFAATVLHSLDHELMEWNLEDPLWLDVKDPKFGKMAELGRIVRVGFVPQVPGYYFHRFFKGSGEPFFETVYAKASKVNKKMADCLETCICR